MIEIVPVDGLPEVEEGDDLGALIAERAELRGGDVVVVAQKAVSNLSTSMRPISQRPGMWLARSWAYCRS